MGDGQGWRACHRGARCAERSVRYEGDRRIVEGHISPWTLCRTDRAILEVVIGELPGLFRLLDRALTEPVTRSRSGPKVSGTPDRGLPIRMDVEAHLREFLATLQGVADELPGTVGLPAMRRATTPRHQVEAICELLAVRMDTMLAIPGSGGANATALMDLHRRSRNMLGLNQRRTAVPGVCPDCELRTLTRAEDDPELWGGIICGNCGRPVNRTDYAQQVANAASSGAESAKEGTSDHDYGAPQ